ncbi:MAG: LPXTG cell wall anchor domain-containing protein [Oscillospiraceae bacterium]|nr:LPXTG cell wall anchor domain-containing protein [Oscillospiraceae bacterium]
MKKVNLLLNMVFKNIKNIMLVALPVIGVAVIISVFAMYSRDAFMLDGSLPYADGETICSLEAHTHTAECYELAVLCAECDGNDESEDNESYNHDDENANENEDETENGNYDNTNGELLVESVGKVENTETAELEENQENKENQENTESIKEIISESVEEPKKTEENLEENKEPEKIINTEEIISIHEEETEKTEKTEESAADAEIETEDDNAELVEVSKGKKSAVVPFSISTAGNFGRSWSFNISSAGSETESAGTADKFNTHINPFNKEGCECEYVLICGFEEEHIHSEECYPEEETENNTAESDDGDGDDGDGSEKSEENNDNDDNDDIEINDDGDDEDDGKDDENDDDEIPETGAVDDTVISAELKVNIGNNNTGFSAFNSTQTDSEPVNADDNLTVIDAEQLDPYLSFSDWHPGEGKWIQVQTSLLEGDTEQTEFTVDLSFAGTWNPLGANDIRMFQMCVPCQVCPPSYIAAGPDINGNDTAFICGGCGEEWGLWDTERVSVSVVGENTVYFYVFWVADITGLEGQYGLFSDDIIEFKISATKINTPAVPEPLTLEGTIYAEVLSSSEDLSETFTFHIWELENIPEFPVKFEELEALKKNVADTVTIPWNTGGSDAPYKIEELEAKDEPYYFIIFEDQNGHGKSGWLYDSLAEFLEVTVTEDNGELVYTAVRSALKFNYYGFSNFEPDVIYDFKGDMGELQFIDITENEPVITDNSDPFGLDIRFVNIFGNAIEFTINLTGDLDITAVEAEFNFGYSDDIFDAGAAELFNIKFSPDGTKTNYEEICSLYSSSANLFIREIKGDDLSWEYDAGLYGVSHSNFRGELTAEYWLLSYETDDEENFISFTVKEKTDEIVFVNTYTVIELHIKNEIYSLPFEGTPVPSIGEITELSGDWYSITAAAEADGTAKTVEFDSLGHKAAYRVTVANTSQKRDAAGITFEHELNIILDDDLEDDPDAEVNLSEPFEGNWWLIVNDYNIEWLLELGIQALELNEEPKIGDVIKFDPVGTPFNIPKGTAYGDGIIVFYFISEPIMNSGVYESTVKITEKPGYHITEAGKGETSGRTQLKVLKLTLPDTGGIALPFMAIGTVLLTGAAGIIYYRRKILNIKEQSE